jgi:hypothetical protein
MAKGKQKTLGTKLRPSNSDRFLNCPASVVAAQDLPVGDGTVYSETGNVAHALAEVSYEQGKNPADFLGERVCEADGIKIPVDPKMVEDITFYLNWIDSMGFTSGVMETQIQLPWIPNRGGEVTTGFIDFFGHNENLDVLGVVDYKNGVMPVPDDSFQFAMYGMSMLLDEDSPYQDYNEIHTFRVQPNVMGGDRLGSHVWTKDALIELKDRIITTVDWVNTTKPEALTDSDFSSGHWCKFCPNKHKCPLKINDMFSVVPVKENSCKLPEVSKLSDNMIVQLLEKRKDIIEWLNSVYDHEYSKALKGDVIQGMKLVEGNKKPRSWLKHLTTGELEMELRAAGLDIDDCYQPEKLITPATAKKLFNGKLTHLEHLLKPTERSVSLVPDSDKRVAKGTGLFDAVPVSQS